jgi:hypothetical protein
MHQARRKNQRAIRSEGHCFVLDPEDVNDLLALMVRRSGTELLEIKNSRTPIEDARSQHRARASVSTLPSHGFHRTFWR